MVALLASCCLAELSKSLDILSEAIGDPTLSVRVSAASAAANVVDALQQQQQQHLDVQMAEPLSRLAAGNFQNLVFACLSAELY